MEPTIIDRSVKCYPLSEAKGMEQIIEYLSGIHPKERLIRIMGTFDLATGHAETWDELLDSLERELRDVLGHYRTARE